MSENDKETNFEASLAELEGLVKEMESGELTLEESLQKYERGQNLIKQCQKALTDAEERIKALIGDDE